jgi:foldase protein PrsA
MKYTKIMALLLVLAMVFTLVACGDATDVDSPVAKVGNVEISQSELDQYTYLYCFIQGIDLSSVTDDNLDYIKTMILEDLIALKAMEIYFADDETVLPEDYETAADDFVTMVTGEETASAYMEKYNVSDQALKDFYISQYYSVAFFEELKASIPEVTDEDVQAYYDENQAAFEVDEVTARHILVEDKDLAEEILAKIKAGEDFAELAAEYGTDGTAARGGDLGTFGRNAMIPDFEAAAFALEIGELSGVVETEFGFHIIQVTDKNQGMESFENVKESIRATLQNDALGQVYTAKVEELREEFGVEYRDKEETE